MIEKAEATLRADKGLESVAVQMVFEGVTYTIRAPRSATSANVIAEARVDPGLIHVQPEDRRNSAFLVMEEGAGVGRGLVNLADFLSLQLGTWVNCSMGQRTAAPEDEADERLLATWGTSSISGQISVGLLTRSFAFADLNEAAHGELFRRAAGLRLFADSLANRTDSARFRDLWRLLEAAFGSRDKKLLGLLERFDPAVRMRFSRAELKKLHSLRGRVSHAETKAGLAEIARADHEAFGVLGRLTALAEQVLLNKATWGVPTPDHVWRAKVRSFVGPATD